jgi:hypothetical protein
MVERRRKQTEHRMKSGGIIPAKGVQRNREGRRGVGIDGETLGVVGVVFSFDFGIWIE